VTGQYPDPVLDHLAIGTGDLDDGWALFSGVLGGRWAYGHDSPGYWWGQLAFGTGPKIELLTPTGGPDAAFLERFLEAHGPGPHHYNFQVPDLRATLRRVADLDIEPVQVSLDEPRYKEAFVRARSAHGIVIQIVEQEDPPSSTGPPAGLGTPAAAADLLLVEQHVQDLGAALRLFTTVFEGSVDDSGTDHADVVWPHGGRIRLVRDRSPDAGGRPMPGYVHHVEFGRSGGDSLDDDAATAMKSLASRLGVEVSLREEGL